MPPDVCRVAGALYACGTTLARSGILASLKWEGRPAVKVKISIVLTVAVLTVVAAPAVAATLRQFAQHQIELAVKRDCHSYEAFQCVGWDVWGCQRIARLKVRCEAVEEFRDRNEKYRACYFSAAFIQHNGRARIHFGYTRCNDAEGNPV